MSLTTEFNNRELEMRDPRKLIIVTAAHLRQYPDQRELLAKYHDLRADAPLDESIAASVKLVGAVHTPVFITQVEGLGEVVIAGRQRVRAALNAGLTEVPVILHSDDQKVNVMLELSENIARRQNTARESAYAFRKALQSGLTQDEVAAMAGVTPANVSYILSIGDMPPIVHKYIEENKLSQTAALSLKKTLGKKAPKGSGLTAIYDEKEVKATLEKMEESARLEGGNAKGGKIKVKQAKNSKPGFVEGLSKKEWEALVQAEDVPEDYKALIEVFIGIKSMAQAKASVPEHLDWLRKIAPQPKAKKVKEPKVKEDKKTKTVTVEVEDTTDISELFK